VIELSLTKRLRSVVLLLGRLTNHISHLWKTMTSSDSNRIIICLSASTKDDWVSSNVFIHLFYLLHVCILVVCIFTFTFKSFSRRSYPEWLTNWCIHLMTSSGTVTLVVFILTSLFIHLLYFLELSVCLCVFLVAWVDVKHILMSYPNDACKLCIADSM
jgi:hypothetical protein